MKIIFSIDELLDYLQILNQVIPSRSSRPVLSQILMEADGKKVNMTATDLEVAISCSLQDVKIEKPGKIIVSASRLYAICHELKKGELVVSLKKNNLHVVSEQSEFHIPLEDVDDFPELDFQSKKCGNMEVSHFLEMIQKTTFATATERSRYAINGIHFESNGSNLVLTATDGRRLANIFSSGLDKSFDFKVIVPSRALSLLGKIIQMSSDEKVKLELDENQIVFHMKHISLLARLISGKFPDYHSVIPKKNKNILKIKKVDFEKIIRTAALMTDDSSRSIRFEFSSGKIKASSKTHSYGESLVEREVDYQGDSIDIRFNPSFLLDGLKVCQSDEVVFSMKDEFSAGLLEEGGESNYKYIITPINLVN
jgi:DNA polymerase-3 subunit beta